MYQTVCVLFLLCGQQAETSNYLFGPRPNQQVNTNPAHLLAPTAHTNKLTHPWKKKKRRCSSQILSKLGTIRSSPQNKTQKMALSLSLRLPATPVLRKTYVQSKPPPVSHCISLRHLRLTTATAPRKNRPVVIKAVEGSQESAEKSETVNEPASPATESSVELSELGSEIKKVLKEKKEQKGGDLLSGVGEEIREIEWPAFGKVLGTTGVVLGVIAGSSVVLLTVNFVLAELSDRVFAGRGVQDFFGWAKINDQVMWFTHRFFFSFFFPRINFLV